MMLTKEQCFEQLLLGKAVKSAGWLERLRLEALQHAEALNFPSSRQDEWRFTDLSALCQHNFQPVNSFAGLVLKDIEKLLIPDAIRLVFVDGCYAAELSDLKRAGKSVAAGSLTEHSGAANSADKLIEANFAQHAPYQEDAFVALNTRFFEDGAWVHVADKVIPVIHILHVATRREAPSAIYPRCMFVAAPGAQATLVEDYAEVEGGIYFSNAVTEIILGEHARLQHVRVQREEKNAFHIGHCSVKLDKDSVYEATSLAFGARVSRHTLHITQQAEGADIRLDGLALINGRQIADTHTRIDHAAPRGKSVQLHKCVADQSAHAIFSGKIVVHAGAVGTDSAQSSRNLLLSDKAHIDTQPQLEIFNDNVSCKHGATVGQLDADALFFLKSRGLTEAHARSLLIHAFAAEIINKIPVPSLVEALNRTVFAGMNGVRI